MSGDEKVRRVVTVDLDPIAALLLEHWRTPTSGCMCGQMGLGESYPNHVAAALAPAIEAIARETAARELRAAGDELERRFSPAKAANLLRAARIVDARADALDPS